MSPVSVHVPGRMVCVFDFKCNCCPFFECSILDVVQVKYQLPAWAERDYFVCTYLVTFVFINPLLLHVQFTWSCIRVLPLLFILLSPGQRVRPEEFEKSLSWGSRLCGECSVWFSPVVKP